MFNFLFKPKKFRIIKHTTENDDGSCSVRFYPQKKGWFFWNYFYYYDGTCPFEYCFNTEVDAENFIEREVKNDSSNATLVVKEFTIDTP